MAISGLRPYLANWFDSSVQIGIRVAPISKYRMEAGMPCSTTHLIFSLCFSLSNFLDGSSVNLLDLLLVFCDLFFRDR